MRMPAAFLAQAAGQAGADVSMHACDVRRGGSLAGTDRPHRFVGDRGAVCPRTLRYAARQLAMADVKMIARRTFGLGLADANDGEQTGAPGRLPFAAIRSFPSP